MYEKKNYLCRKINGPTLFLLLIRYKYIIPNVKGGAIWIVCVYFNDTPVV